MRRDNLSKPEYKNVSVSHSQVDISKLTAECKPELDEFYLHADPLIRDVRNMAVKILNGGAAR